MKFYSKILFIILFIAIDSNSTSAQSNTVSGGSAGSGTRGNSSFAIGQVFHCTLTNKTTSNSKEIQKKQTKEIVIKSTQKKLK